MFGEFDIYDRRALTIGLSGEAVPPVQVQRLRTGGRSRTDVCKFGSFRLMSVGQIQPIAGYAFCCSDQITTNFHGSCLDGVTTFTVMEPNPSVMNAIHSFGACALFQQRSVTV
jgi:hypothetical protein